MTATKPQIKCAPKRSKATTAAESAARYKRRDAHEAFFRPQTRAAKQARAEKAKAKAKKKKQPRRFLTDKERRAFAREHYEMHHTDKPLDFSPPPIDGHHHQQHTHPESEANQTIPIPPPSIHSMLNYMQNTTQHRANIKKI